VAEGFGPPKLAETRLARAIKAMALVIDPGGDDALDEGVGDG
jgi:hypothetical protein